MPTVNQNFVNAGGASSVLRGSATAANQIAAVDPATAKHLVGDAGSSAIDKVDVNFSTDASAKHGAARYTLSGTTPKNIDLTNLATGAASSAGDTGFSTLAMIVLYNDGAADVTIGPGASNPAPSQLAGTSPTLNVIAGGKVSLPFNNDAVDSTHKILTMTPTSGGSLSIAVSGS